MLPQMENPMDLSSVPEELLCTESIIKYIVKDKTTDTQIPDRAQKSMPTNLVLKPTCALPDSSIIGVWAKEYIPAGTRYSLMISSVVHFSVHLYFYELHHTVLS